MHRDITRGNEERKRQTGIEQIDGSLYVTN